MKASEFRKLIREEVRKVLKEVTGKAFALIVDKDGNFLQQDLASYLKEAGNLVRRINREKLSTAGALSWTADLGYKNAEYEKAVSALKATSDFYYISTQGKGVVVAAIPKGSDIKSFEGTADGPLKLNLPYNVKVTLELLKQAEKLGMKQGPSPQFSKGSVPNADFYFEYDDPSGTAFFKGDGSDPVNPSEVVIVNPKMKNDPIIKALARKSV
tara:strand:+ start:518 stop:1156 length:639 start_codon:yes stop_codon:yes gene_type:complete